MTAPTSTAPAKKVNPNAPTLQKVISVKHYTDRLFAFRLERPPSFRFRSGEFVMIGLPKEDGRPLLRAYSIASPAWDDELEFYSIKVQDGPLTSRLQNIQPGDEVLLGKKPTGTLVLDALVGGKRLYLFSTGTGFAPFASLIREPETYERFEQIIVTHTCRDIAELDYGYETVEAAKNDPLVGDEASKRLVHFTSCTREDHPQMGRITNLIDSGELFEKLGVPKLNPETDRGMICGSQEMLNDTKDRM
ncbi:MAG: ferredoxin--NADP reductase, partial [Pseudomonadota bacterium]